VYIAVRRNSATPLWETHMPYGITQCYLPPDRGESIPYLPLAEADTWFSTPEEIQGWVDLCYSKADRPGFEPWPVSRKSNALLCEWCIPEISSYTIWYEKCNPAVSKFCQIVEIRSDAGSWSMYVCLLLVQINWAF